IHLPEVVQTGLRVDITHRAAVGQQYHQFQPQGRNLMAGQRTTAQGFRVGRARSRVRRSGGHGRPARTAAFAPGPVRRRSAGPQRVVGGDRNASKALRNFEGVEVNRARDLSVEALAPGTHPGRLTIWSESAIKTVAERKW